LVKKYVHKCRLFFTVILYFAGEPPEKFVKYLARHEYKIGIQFKDSKEQDSYRGATAAVPAEPEPPEEKMREYEDFPDENGRKDSDSDSD
jgi:hypothetical protein